MREEIAELENTVKVMTRNSQNSDRPKLREFLSDNKGYIIEFFENDLNNLPYLTGIKTIRLYIKPNPLLFGIHLNKDSVERLKTEPEYVAQEFSEAVKRELIESLPEIFKEAL